MPPPLPPFPAGAVRDALGLARTLWAIESEHGTTDRMKVLQQAGDLLVMALDLSRKRPESLGYKAALPRAIDGVNLLASMGWSGDLAEVIRKARERVRGPLGKQEDGRDARKKAEEARR